MWQVAGVWDLRSVFESLKITCLVGDGRWKKEHDGFFEPVASGRSLTRKMTKRAAIKAMNELCA